MENYVNIRKLIKSRSMYLRQGVYAPDFWGFVRHLENSNPALPRLGYARHPSLENVRFGQAPFLCFPSTDIAEIIEGKGNIDATIFTYFFGLLGVNGPMPLEFTNYVYQRSHNHYDHTWRRFLDIINHRFTVFFYRAFSQNEQAISFDRSEDDAIAGIVKSFAGLPPKLAFDKKQERLALTYTRHIGSAVKNRWGLEAMLRHLFGFPLEVNDFVIASYDIPQTFRARLGNAETATLGVNLQIGRRYFSITQRFEIKIGPIMFDDYQIIMSGLSGFDLLAQAVNLYLDRPLDYHLIFTLLSNTIPKARLGFDWSDDAADGNDGASNDAAQLGYSGWLGRPSGTETTLTIDASRLNRLRHKDSYKRGVKVE